MLGVLQTTRPLIGGAAPYELGCLSARSSRATSVDLMSDGMSVPEAFRKDIDNL